MRAGCSVGAVVAAELDRTAFPYAAARLAGALGEHGWTIWPQHPRIIPPNFRPVPLDFEDFDDPGFFIGRRRLPPKMGEATFCQIAHRWARTRPPREPGTFIVYGPSGAPKLRERNPALEFVPCRMPRFERDRRTLERHLGPGGDWLYVGVAVNLRDAIYDLVDPGFGRRRSRPAEALDIWQLDRAEDSWIVWKVSASPVGARRAVRNRLREYAARHGGELPFACVVERSRHGRSRR